ncbi:MAG: transposase [Deltaproteobacteria bacterium]|nr:transposase [Deltaproteobacteria bacterium]
MTQPRLVVPGDTLMITRRTLRRHHLFRPDSAIRQLYLYTLALCARQFGILVHAVTLMSTHEHLIVTDPQGRYPDFLRRLHRLVSLGTKVLRKWEGPTWDHEQSSVVRLLTQQVTVLPHELGRRLWTVKRPEAYFDTKNRQWPDTVELTLTLPPLLERTYDAQAGREAVQVELERQERLAHHEIKKRGWRVLGAERIRRLSPYRRATSFEPLRDRNPTFAVGRGQKKMFLQAVAELRAFRNAYRQALEQWRAGLRSVVFPQGTWCMCRVHCDLSSSRTCCEGRL